jgi:hypothetical protein
MMFFSSMLGCSILHEVSNWIPMTRWSHVRHRGNLIASMIFQIYFVWRAGYLLYLEQRDGVTEWIQEETLQQLYVIGGYFIYDLCYLLQTTPCSGFVLHHLVGLGMLSVLYQIGLPSPPLVSYYNQLCFIIEVTSPVISLRYFTKGSVYERVNDFLMIMSYTVFRVVLYPLLSYRLHLHLQTPMLFYSFMGIYAMSLLWYRRILHIIFCKRS